MLLKSLEKDEEHHHNQRAQRMEGGFTGILCEYAGDLSRSRPPQFARAWHHDIADKKPGIGSDPCFRFDRPA